MNPGADDAPGFVDELRRLQAMVGELRAQLVGPDDPAAVSPGPCGLPRDAIALGMARRQLKLRRDRERRLRKDMFGEPAWDMLLDLFIAQCENRAIAVTSLCIAANVPPTTALRYIRDLERNGEIVSAGDPVDRRRRTLRLSRQAFEAMRDTLAPPPAPRRAPR